MGLRGCGVDQRHATAGGPKAAARPGTRLPACAGHATALRQPHAAPRLCCFIPKLHVWSSGTPQRCPACRTSIQMPGVQHADCTSWMQLRQVLLSLAMSSAFRTHPLRRLHKDSTHLDILALLQAKLETRDVDLVAPAEGARWHRPVASRAIGRAARCAGCAVRRDGRARKRRHRPTEPGRCHLSHGAGQNTEIGSCPLACTASLTRSDPVLHAGSVRCYETGSRGVRRNGLSGKGLSARGGPAGVVSVRGLFPESAAAGVICGEQSWAMAAAASS